MNGQKLFEKKIHKLFGIGILYLLMSLLLCHGFMNNINYTIILLCPSWKLEYYFSKGFVMLEHNSNKLKKIANEEKQSCNAYA